MRQWLVDPKIMCQKHLCGEHVELHMTIGTIKKGIKIDGYLKNNLLEPRSIYERHKMLAVEMLRRGYNHKSPLEEVDCECILNLRNEQQYWEIDKERSQVELLSRCEICNERYNKLL